MATDDKANGTAVAVLDRPVSDETPAKADKKRRGKKKDDEQEYELEVGTPFGKLEIEFEPASTKKRKDEEKREKAATKAEKDAAKAAKHAEPAAAKGGRSLMPLLIIFGVVAAAVIIAVWLFARPGEEEPEAVPDEYRKPEEAPVMSEPEGFAAQARTRIMDAIRAGRRASREAQREQETRFRELTSG